MTNITTLVVAVAVLSRIVRAGAAEEQQLRFAAVVRLLDAVSIIESSHLLVAVLARQRKQAARRACVLASFAYVREPILVILIVLRLRLLLLLLAVGAVEGQVLH